MKPKKCKKCRTFSIHNIIYIYILIGFFLIFVIITKCKTDYSNQSVVTYKTPKTSSSRIDYNTPYQSNFMSILVKYLPYIGIIFLIILIVGWGFTTKWKFFCRSEKSCTPNCQFGNCGSDGCGGTCKCPDNMSCVNGLCKMDHYDGISIPQSITNNNQKQAVQDYIFGNYPLMNKDNYHEDFWKSLDFFWNVTCSTSSGIVPGGTAQSYFPNNQTNLGNPVFRYIMQKFDEAGGKYKWLVFTPQLSTIAPTEPTAGFTYSADPSQKLGSISLTTYDLFLLPLCSFHVNPNNITKFNGIMVNRYPAGHLRTQAIAYAATNTGNKIIKSQIIPGVDQIHLNDGFKSNAVVEISHCDTHSTSLASSLNCINACDTLSMNGCTTNGPPTIGFGKWVYYSRGTGIWMNIGKTAVFKNKIDAIMGSINLWNGKDDRTGSLVDTRYDGSLQGTFADSSKFETWQKFITNENNNVKTALESILTGACLKSSKPPIGPTTAVVDMLDKTYSQCNNNDDPLGIGDSRVYTGTCKSTGVSYCKDSGPNNIALWWHWGNGQQDWGSLSPMAPNKYTNQEDICAWILWASVNGYDFANNPNQYTWSQPFTNKYLTNDTVNNSIILNVWLQNMGNSGYTTDDIFIGLANYNRYDSIQLTTSGILQNLLACEILIFTGTIDSTIKNTSGWICDSVNPKANMQCNNSSGESATWLGGSDTVFFNMDPTNQTNQAKCTAKANQCGDQLGYYLNCNLNKDVDIAYSENGYSYPMSSKLPTNFIPSCNTK